MNAIDVLGSLLGGGNSDSRSRSNPASNRNSSGGSIAGGIAGGILDKLLKGALGAGSPSRSAGGSTGQASRPSASGPTSSGGYDPRGYQPSAGGPSTNYNNGPIDIDREARSLEEMLGVTSDSAPNSSFPAAPSPSDPSPYRPAPMPRNQPQPGSTRATPNPSMRTTANSTMTANDEAIILIQALINAAKADGRIDANEQQSILSQVPNDPETINFLRQQFAQPLDVREFAWSVPLGMEIKVYTMSLAGMQLDSQVEADYLVQLAHGLRLSPETCRQIHARYGAADIF